MSHVVRVVLYGRPECHLCDEARSGLLEIAGEAGVTVDLTEIDIEADTDLLRRYLERIPVITMDGEEVSELVLDQEAVRSEIARLAAAAPSP